MKRIRTFIAVELDRPIRDRLIALQERLAREVPDVKWTEPENLHLTLLFLGEVGLKEVPAICRSVEDTCKKHKCFPLAVATTGCFPHLRRPRILWVGITTGAEPLVALHDDLEEPLLEMRCYRREDRAYSPHITLGRVRGEDVGQKVAAELTKLTNWQAGEMVVDEVRVMSSELQPKGPVYSVLGRSKLPK